jgi:hypothetical protein
LGQVQINYPQRLGTRPSRLWQQQGKRAAARDLLTPLYHWLTEGLDTVDLHEAKAVLEALGTSGHDGSSIP